MLTLHIPALGCRAHRLHPGVSLRSCVRFLLEPEQVQLGSLRYSNETSAVKDDGYLEPKDLDETVSELHLSALGAELTVLTQVTQPSSSKTLSRVSTAVIEMQSPVRILVAARISFSPSVVLVLWCSLPMVNPFAPYRRACTFFRWQRLRMSRPRRTFPFLLSSNFDILTFGPHEVTQVDQLVFPDVHRVIVCRCLFLHCSQCWRSVIY